MNRNSPIGVFDSGLGGLTVLREMIKALPQESFVYIGDLARLPYGSKSPETIRKYGEQLINRLKEYQVKCVVVACNSASTVFLGEDQFSGIPLFNVIEPGARTALRESAQKNIGVIATTATVRKKAYTQAIHKLDLQAQVKEQACPLLVPLVEEGLSGDEITSLVLEKYLIEFKANPPDTLVLGCTHYPMLKKDIQRVLGTHIKLIDSGAAVASDVASFLKQNKLLAEADKKSQLTLLMTDFTEHFEKVANEWLHPFTVNQIKKIDL
jgi:glutamate racemase